jgi:hypothetical protein
MALFYMILSGGCDKPRRIVYTKEQLRKINESTLSELPQVSNPLNVNFENKIRLIAVEGPSTVVRPGARTKITYYWECLEPLQGEWTVFGHLEQPGKRQLLDHDPVDNLYPIKEWKKGDIIKDVQSFTLDKDFKGGEATLWIGIFNLQSWKEARANDRLKVVDPGTVSEHGDNRLKVVTFKVSSKKAKTNRKNATARYTARPARSPITVDGKLDEEAWKKASKTRLFVQPNGNKGDGALRVTAKMVYDTERMYFAFDARDTDIQSQMFNRDDRLWEADVVEVFIDPNGDGKNYLEMQVAPTNAIFDAIFPSTTDRSFEKYAPTTSLNIESAVFVKGTLNNANDQDTQWTTEIAIPFTDIPGVTGTPKVGSKWTVNLYRIDDKAKRRGAYMRAWAAVGGNFHDFQKSGVVIFAGAIPAKVTPRRPPLPTPTVPPNIPTPTGGTAR